MNIFGFIQWQSYNLRERIGQCSDSSLKNDFGYNPVIEAGLKGKILEANGAVKYYWNIPWEFG